MFLDGRNVGKVPTAEKPEQGKLLADSARGQAEVGMDSKAPRNPNPQPEPYTPPFNHDRTPPPGPFFSPSKPSLGRPKPARQSPGHKNLRSPPKQKHHPRGPSHKNARRQSPPTPPSPSPQNSPNKCPPSDYHPKYKAEFFIDLKLDNQGRRREPVKAVADTGCSKSAISEDFFRSSPHLQTKPYRPLTTRGTAINGSKVLTLGIVNIAFRINGRFHHQNFRVVRGLVQNVFLGWDWFSKTGAIINTDCGSVQFPRYGDSAPLNKNSLEISGCYYRVPDDKVIPANCKAHISVEVMVDGHNLPNTSNLVETEPFHNTGTDIWASRNIDTIKDGRFKTEVINAHNYPVKLEKGRVLGYANFTSEDEFNNVSVKTDMFCHYDPSPSPEHTSNSHNFAGQSSNPKQGTKLCNSCKQPKQDSFEPLSFFNPPNESQPAKRPGSQNDEPIFDMDDTIDEIICDPHPNQAQTPIKPEPCDPQDTPPPNPLTPKIAKDNIPIGAKPLKLDFSNISKRAIPYKNQLKQLLEVDHAGAFSRHDRDYGKTDLIHYRAHIRDRDMPPIAVPPYRTRPEMREVIDNQAFEMIADGLVQPSKSPFSAPILLARKKLGGWRFLTDFRKINDKCDKVVFPLPRIEDSIQKLDNPQFFTSLDLLKGFWQLPIHPDDRKFFAFSTESLHLEYLVAPMGAKNSPSALSALMQLVLRGLPIQHVISYLDDILIATSNMEDHLTYLDKVLTALEIAGLKLNPQKCAIAQDSIVCLGHKLSKSGVAPDPSNVDKIRAWRAPPNVKKLKTFLGLCGYYRHFVKDYSKIAQPLTDLTHDDAKWEWQQIHQEAFEKLRNTLISDQIMSYPDFTKPFIIKSDASDAAVGYVLTQMINGKERVISYGSKKLTETQMRWCTYDREFWALLCAIRANSHYLRHAKFSAIIDHRPLLAWKKVDPKKDPTGRRTRWAIELSCYDFDLIFKAGRIHSDADALSRLGNENDEVALDDDETSFVLIGMEDPDEYSAIRLNANSDGAEQLRKAQDEDSVISEVKKFVKSRKRIPHNFPEPWYYNNSRWLIMKKGILYKKSYSESIHAQVFQAIIPYSMQNEVMSDLHGDYLSGHPCPIPPSDMSHIHPQQGSCPTRAGTETLT